MSLKLRYAAFLLAVAALLAMVSALSVHLVLREWYIGAVLLLALLYLTTFALGRRFGTIFLTLSLLRRLRRKGGVLSRSECESYLEGLLRGRRSPAEAERIKDDILHTLVMRQVVAIDNERVVLLEP